MGKKQHQKDKLYLTSTEWRTEGGGFKGKKHGSSEFKRLPFFCCSLSLQPFENPLCTKEGIVFDLMNIVPFLKKYGVSPVTGEKMSAKELIKLNFHKNKDGKYHCPVTFKIFNENTNIVAIKPTGNVFASEAVEQLNIKTKHFNDLLTDEPFTRKDIITIQDPSNLEKFNLSNFYHIKNKLKFGEDDEQARKDPRYNLKAINSETRDVLNELDRDFKPAEMKDDGVAKKADKFNSAHYSTGKVAASFTSTAVDVSTHHEAAVIDEDILRYERVKKKGYVRMMTNKGCLNIELHCDMVPKTCENFIKHCACGYYRNTIFHRSIRNFVLQGGDPTGTGKGGESIWGKPFNDECKPNLKHEGRGVLSMANSGPNTNKSQFFFTYRSAKHLDGKHTVFGRIVGGLDTLDKIEKIETDKTDRPVVEIKIEDCIVFVNPYDEADEMLKQEREDDIQKLAEEAETERKRKLPRKPDAPIVQKTFKSGIGKYINPSNVKNLTTVQADEIGQTETKKKKVSQTTFGNFSSW